MTTFDIALPKESITLPDNRIGRFDVEITNRTDQPVDVGLKSAPGEGTEPDWFTLPAGSPFTLAARETRQITVDVEVPVEAPAGTYRGAITVYAVDDPNGDFATSPSVELVATAMAEPGKPRWLPLALIAAVVILVAVSGAIVWKIRGGDDESVASTEPMVMPDLVAMTVEEADDAMGDVELTVVADPSASSDRCVYLQGPNPGQTASEAVVLAVACPTPSARFKIPEISDSLCAGWSFTFCQRLSEDHGVDFADGASWSNDGDEMAKRFAAAFTIEGREMPGLAGMAVTEARDAADQVGVSLSVTSDGDLENPCVLFHYPFASMPVADGEAVTVVVTPCPAEANHMAAVEIATAYDQTTFATLCDHESAYCDAIEAELGDNYVAARTPTSLLRSDLQAMLTEFQRRWSNRLSDLLGLSPHQAQERLNEAGLTLKTSPPEAINGNPAGSCYRANDQIPEAGTRLEDIPNATVVVFYTFRKPCSFISSKSLITADMVDEATTDIVGVDVITVDPALAKADLSGG